MSIRNKIMLRKRANISIDQDNPLINWLESKLLQLENASFFSRAFLTALLFK